MGDFQYCKRKFSIKNYKIVDLGIIIITYTRQREKRDKETGTIV